MLGSVVNVPVKQNGNSDRRNSYGQVIVPQNYNLISKIVFSLGNFKCLEMPRMQDFAPFSPKLMGA